MTNCTSPKAYAGLLEGYQTFAVMSFDQNGAHSVAATYTWRIDMTAPVVQITQMPPAVSNSSTATFTFTATDALSLVSGISCRIDNGTYGTCVSPKTFTGLQNGPHSFDIRAVDSAGNLSVPVNYMFSVAP